MMKTIKSILVGLAMVGLPFFAHAAPYSSPYAVVESLYEPQQVIAPFSFEKADSGLKNLWLNENKRFSRTSKSFLNFNPACGCVGKWTVLEKQVVYTELSDGFVIASIELITDQGPLKLEASLRKRAQNWFVSDFRYHPRSDTPWSLQAEMRHYLGS